MKILVTGSCGRVGRAIAINLMKDHQVVGLDLMPCSTANFVGDIRDEALMEKALKGIDVVVHTAALHAPHVGLRSDREFEEINAEATERLALAAGQHGVRHFVFTSTTALYGYASSQPERAAWIDETVTPQPRTIYHRTKIEAERRLEALSKQLEMPVTVLQMSRCFPEPADLMAVYRLNRGVDFRDVASAHRAAIERRPEGFRRYIISGATPFTASDCELLFDDAAEALRRRAPELVAAFAERGWPLPGGLDRVYDSTRAQRELGWRSQHGFESVLDLLDSELAEVLPVQLMESEKWTGSE